MNFVTSITKATQEARHERCPRLLVVDDSVVIRSVIERIVTGQGGLSVAAKIANIPAAISYLRDHQVDIILLDHEMPGITGIDALPEILSLARGARVAILSGHCASGSEAAVRALALGASDVIAKPGIRDYDAGFADMLVKRLLRLALPALMGQQDEEGVALRPIPAGFRLSCLGIGASTGGIHALAQLLENKQVALDVPILVTQHLPEAFMPYFAMQLARMTHLPVKIADHGERLQPNHIYVAPGHANLLCARGPRGIAMADLKPQRANPLDPLPSLNPMFTAMAKTYGRGAAAIILTGMGRDGTAGAQAITAAGGLTIAQDRESSVIWGMPGHAAQSGLASALLPPAQMIDYLNSFCGIAP